jgi:hypothetical protein
MRTSLGALFRWLGGAGCGLGAGSLPRRLFSCGLFSLRALPPLFGSPSPSGGAWHRTMRRRRSELSRRQGVRRKLAKRPGAGSHFPRRRGHAPTKAWRGWPEHKPIAGLRPSLHSNAQGQNGKFAVGSAVTLAGLASAIDGKTAVR